MTGLTVRCPLFYPLSIALGVLGGRNWRRGWRHQSGDLDGTRLDRCASFARARDRRRGSNRDGVDLRAPLTRNRGRRGRRYSLVGEGVDLSTPFAHGMQRDIDEQVNGRCYTEL